MPKLRVHNFAVSLDGYAAGPDQSEKSPLGVGGEQLHEWALATRSWRQRHGLEGGEEGIDDALVADATEGIGATIMGRNMFGPIRGPWSAEGSGEQWRGWWGDEPPFGHPVFVLTHHAQDPVQVGATRFTFVTDGIESALRQAVDAAGGQDVAIGGGASTIQQYLRSGLVDEMHLAQVPVLLGSGERLFDDLAGLPEHYECGFIASSSVLHLRVARRLAH